MWVIEPGVSRCPPQYPDQFPHKGWSPDFTDVFLFDRWHVDWRKTRRSNVIFAMGNKKSSQFFWWRRSPIIFTIVVGIYTPRFYRQQYKPCQLPIFTAILPSESSGTANCHFPKVSDILGTWQIRRRHSNAGVTIPPTVVLNNNRSCVLCSRTGSHKKHHDLYYFMLDNSGYRVLPVLYLIACESKQPIPQPVSIRKILSCVWPAELPHRELLILPHRGQLLHNLICHPRIRAKLACNGFYWTTVYI